LAPPRMTHVTPAQLPAALAALLSVGLFSGSSAAHPPWHYADVLTGALLS
jgi:hypothetical protein